MTHMAQALGDTGAPGHNPIFEVRFALQNHPIPDVALPGLSIEMAVKLGDIANGRK